MAVTRRLKRILVRPDIILDMCKQGASALCVKGVPVTATFRGVAHDPQNNCWVIFLEDESFDEVPENLEIPIHDYPEFRRIGNVI